MDDPSRSRRFVSILIIVCALGLARVGAAATEQWGVYELSLPGPADGNPFIDVSLTARFTHDAKAKSVDVTGFYDGDGTYRVRFMPDEPGVWRYQTTSNRAELSGKTGEFTCTKPASANNHGPVRVHNTFHFAYADGTPFRPLGTTTYGWAHQPPQLQRQTLETLKASPFNKVRMCVLPTGHDDGGAPVLLPFEVRADGGPDPAGNADARVRFDHNRFNPAFFRMIEQRIADLCDLGIEADVILFHPYGNAPFGFGEMDAAVDDRYARYVVARLAAYRNVWWAIANEYDLLRRKQTADWDRLFQIVQTADPYGHLRSIHQAGKPYDMSKPWVTHVSAQNPEAVAELGRAPIFRQLTGKPVVFDEIRYEGNLDRRWGNLSAEELVLRCWIGTAGGTYVTHGETIDVPGQPAWGDRGGVLRGQSTPRLAFLKKHVLDAAPPEGINPIDQYFRSDLSGKPAEFYLVYFGSQRPTEWRFELYRERLSDGMKFRVDVLDTWNMTVTPIDTPFTIVRHSPYTFRATGDATVPLPATPYLALRITRVHDPASTAPARSEK